jgi:hypothetical protein
LKTVTALWPSSVPPGTGFGTRTRDDPTDDALAPFKGEGAGTVGMGAAGRNGAVGGVESQELPRDLDPRTDDGGSSREGGFGRHRPPLPGLLVWAR